jgi:tRNA modification GTPase
MTFASNDTITAVATAPGRGGVGIVRVSGPQCRAMAEAILGLTPNRATHIMVRFTG